MNCRTVDSILEPKRNNFNLLRLLAASSVILSHALYLHSGHKSDEVLYGVTYYYLGDHAVNVFFVLSGLTVAASLDRSKSSLEFLLARVLRIFPAIIVCTAALIALGAVVTTEPLRQFLTDTQVWRYALNTLVLMSANTGLPGVFDTNPVPVTLNAPIWTLKFEIACYLALALICRLGLLTRQRFVPVLVVTWAAAAALLVLRTGHDTTPIDQTARFWICFSLGTAFYVFRDRVPLSGVAALALMLVFWLLIDTRGERLASIIATGYAALWLGQLPTGFIREATNKVDLSYGMYIFGWPISQTLIYAFPGLGVGAVIVLSLVLAAIVALPSWLFVERPAMRTRARLVATLRQQLPWLRRRDGVTASKF